MWAITNTASLEHRDARARDHQPADQQRDLRVPAEVGPEAGRHPARRVHQQHDDPDAVRARAAGRSSSSTSRPTTRWSRPRTRTTPACSRPGTSTAQLWGATDTAVWVDGQLKAGIAWFAVDAEDQRLGQDRGQDHQAGLPGPGRNNLTYPAIAMGADGQGRHRLHGDGPGLLPERGLRPHRRRAASVGPIHIAAAGLGPGRRVHQLQGVRRRSAPDALGRLRSRGHGREAPSGSRRSTSARPAPTLSTIRTHRRWPTSAAAAGPARRWATGPPASASSTP